ncbi:hypothetical protein FQA39_LY18585 [Lamprigera yunnana]|nr:hypothetical protein FQA39_LY18585 [Lamprigera yunnana]
MKFSSNPENRAKYDKYGEKLEPGEEYEKAQQQAKAVSATAELQFLRKNMFGGTGAGGFGKSSEERLQESSKGQDVRAELTLNLRDAAVTHPQTFEINGKKVRITIPAGVFEMGRKSN